MEWLEYEIDCDIELIRLEIYSNTEHVRIWN